MSAITIGLLSFPTLLLLIFLRVPIGLAMFLTGLGGMAPPPLDPSSSAALSAFWYHRVPRTWMLLVLVPLPYHRRRHDRAFEGFERCLGERNGCVNRRDWSYRRGFF